MQNKPLFRLGTAPFLALFFAGALALPVYSQRNQPDFTSTLLDGSNCVVSGTSTLRGVDNDVEQVSINRQVFERLFSIYVYEDHRITLSCRIDTESYALADLQMGVTDNSAQYGAVNLTVDVYQGGNLKYTYSMRAGSIVNTVLDLNDPEVPRNSGSIAIEMKCSRNARLSGFCHLQFIEARLYPTGDRVSF